MATSVLPLPRLSGLFKKSSASSHGGLAVAKMNSTMTTLSERIELLSMVVPESVFREWKQRAEAIKLVPTREAFNKSVKGLFAFLFCIEAAGSAKLSLPSRAVALLAEAFKASSEDVFEGLCKKEFPCALSSLSAPWKASAVDGDELARCFFINSCLEGTDGLSGTLPSLFTLDHAVKYPLGLRFIRLTEPEAGIYHCEMDTNGTSSDKKWFIHRAISYSNMVQVIPSSLLKSVSSSEVNSSEALYSVAALSLCALFGFEHSSVRPL